MRLPSLCSTWTSAGGAPPDDADVEPLDDEARHGPLPQRERREGGHLHVRHPPAAAADDVLMRFQVGVVARDAARGADPPDQALALQRVEDTVHGGGRE